MNTKSPTTFKKSKKLQFDPSRPCLVLAPLFEFPIRSGDNILVHNRWSSFSRFVPYVDVVGHNVLVRYENGKLVSQVSYDNSTASKYLSSVNVILKRSHYLVEKYLNNAFKKEAIRHLQDLKYGNIVWCYIWTASLLSNKQIIDPELFRNRFHMIETINDEVKWYKNIRTASRNPLAKLTAWLSERWIKQFFKTISNDFLFIHLTKADHQGYRHYFPNHLGHVAPVGTTIKSENNIDLPDKAPGSSLNYFQLLFVGSLNVQMNFDALINFKQNFYPFLHEAIGDKLRITIVGKEPTRKVKELCTKMNWQLFANVSDEQLQDFFRQTTFTILPFNYTTGAKLKLLDSVAYCVPFLATNILAHQIETAVYPCLFSDEPAEWLQRIKDVGPGPISNEYKLDLQQFAMSYSWDALTADLFNYLDTNFDE